MKILEIYTNIKQYILRLPFEKWKIVRTKNPSRWFEENNWTDKPHNSIKDVEMTRCLYNYLKENIIYSRNNPIMLFLSKSLSIIISFPLAQKLCIQQLNMLST